VRQHSFYSAVVRPVQVADLAGVLCGPGRAGVFGRGAAARLTVELDDPWRARRLVAACGQRGIAAMVERREAGGLVVRTAYRADLVGLVRGWLGDGEKVVPSGLMLDGPMLRLWALVAGRYDMRGYLLGLDPAAPATYPVLARALASAGLGRTVGASGRRRAGTETAGTETAGTETVGSGAAGNGAATNGNHRRVANVRPGERRTVVEVVGSVAGGPALRVAGRRRLERLAELVGAPPVGAGAADWPVDGGNDLVTGTVQDGERAR
jgi:hypothetical protein